MERFPYKTRFALPAVSFLLLGGFSFASLVLAAASDAPKAVPVALAVGGLLMTIPALRALAQLREAPKAVVVDEHAVKVPSRRTAKVDRIPWASIQAVELGREAISIRHPWGSSEILKRDVGAQAFARLWTYLDPCPANARAMPATPALAVPMTFVTR